VSFTQESGEDLPQIGRFLLAVLVLLFLGVGGLIARQVVQEQRADAAQELVEVQAERLVGLVDERGALQHLGPILEDVRDPWGNPLTVRYERSLQHDKVQVRSAGPDGVAWTGDDIAASAENIGWLAMAHEAADVIEDVASSATRGIVSGAIEGVVGHLPAPMREKLMPTPSPSPTSSPGT
jgi:hypothetical protein